jgi:NTE family protein
MNDMNPLESSIKEKQQERVDDVCIGKMCQTFKTLVLSGGAFKGFAFIGSIKYLEENGFMKKIDNFVGSSSGAIIAFLLALGYTSIECLDLCLGALDIYNKQQLDMDNVFNVFQTLGLDDGSHIELWLSTCLKRKLKSATNTNINTSISDMTFIEFAKATGKNLVICASEITKQEEIYFSLDDTPNMRVITAIRASIAIPLIFTPVRILDRIYIDAGLMNNFPIEKVKSAVVKETLGITIASKPFHTIELNLLTYGWMILESIFNKVNKKPDLHLSSNVVIDIVDDDQQSLCFDYGSLKQKVNMNLPSKYFQKGYDTISKCMQVSAQKNV